MNGDLARLEKKLEQFMAFCEGLHAENRALRKRVTHMDDERLMLLGKIDSARNRLEALMARLPADAADATDAADTSDTAASTDPITSAAAK